MKVKDKVIILRNPNPEWVGAVGTIMDLEYPETPYVAVSGHYDHLNVDDLEVLPSLATICKQKEAHFDFCRNGRLYYRVTVGNTIYTFPVSTEDLGNSTASKVEKPIILMRYIRKALLKGHFVVVGRQNV